jgi:broad specificity phosphatase PhoE
VRAIDTAADGTMAELLLVRHGQAQSKARDAASYDSLSELGQLQARWLGDWLRQTNGHFDRVITGSLHRQRQTAEAMGYGAQREEDARWNELDYFGMSQAMEAQHGLPFPHSPDHFAEHAPQLFQAWQDGRLRDVEETCDAFMDRVRTALMDAAAPGGRVLVVTSGGVIGAVARQLLGLDVAGMTKVVLHVANSSTHRIEVIRGTPYLNGFNGMAHLAAPDRAHARTYV